MKVSRTIEVFVFIIITAFFFNVAGLSSETHAKWRDQSDQLPGMEDDSSMSTLTYTAVGLVVVGIIYWIVKANKNKQTGDSNKEMDKPLEEESESGGDSSFVKDTWDKSLAVGFSPDF